MDNAKQKNIKHVMQALNITSEKDFKIVMDYLASELQPEAADGKLKHMDSRKPPSEREINSYNINALAIHFEFIYNVWRNQLYPSLKAIDSPLAGKLYDRFTDGRIFLSYIKKAAEDQLISGEIPRID